MALGQKSKEEDASEIEAFAIALDLGAFDLLLEDLDTEYEGLWTSLAVEAAPEKLRDLEPSQVEIVVVAVQTEDERELELASVAIETAKFSGQRVLLVADEISAAAMHRLMRMGADDFIPYPLPEGALAEAIQGIRDRAEGRAAGVTGSDRMGMVLPVYGIAGGVGASTFAANLAWEMADYSRKSDRRIALLDLNFQYGSVATLLDMPRRDAIFEFISQPDKMDKDSLIQCMITYKKRLAVFTAPPDTLPLDFVEPDAIRKLLQLATQSYDIVIVDMPNTLTAWAEEVLAAAETYFTVMEIDMRSAQNMLRFLKLLRSEDLPVEKIQYVLNRAPGFADMSGKNRMKRLCDSLGIEFNVVLPDGGKAITAAADLGSPLADSAKGNPLRKEIRKTALSLLDMADQQRAASQK